LAVRAFSLIQLMVFLVILASLATVALKSGSKSINQPRSDRTQQLIADIRASIAGLPPSPPSRPSARTSSFVADMGRLPRTRLATDVSAVSWLTLDELLTQESLLPFTNYVPTDANTVLYWDPTSTIGGRDARPRGNSDNVLYVPCGWRGPYAYLPPGTTQLLDGWGKPLNALANASVSPVLFYRFGTANVPAAGYAIASSNRAEVAGMSVTGGARGGGSINASDDPYLSPRTMLISSNEITADVRILVKVWSEATSPGTMPPHNNWYVDVRIFGPNPNSDVDPNRPVQCVIKRVDYDSTNIVVSTTRLLVGPKIVIAEIVNNGGNTPGGLRYHSYPVMMNVIAGANNYSSTGLGVY
jgi:Tfp pilus assembly major pilin PilA